MADATRAPTKNRLTTNIAKQIKEKNEPEPMLEYLPKLSPENNFQNPITYAVTQTKLSTLAKAKTLFFF